MMKIYYKPTLYALLFVMGVSVTACYNQEKASVERSIPKQNKRANSVITEDEAVNLIVNLEEVKRKSEVVVKESKGSRHLSTYIDTKPNVKDPNYYVKVAEDNGGSYVAYYIFTVNSKSKAISIYDVLENKLLPLETWRRNTPANER